ncbi:RNA polymerase sigma factor RpoE [Gemmata obscuriglobus]|uniref:Sigma-70 family RNA polymerase sigma factor n=1 Tax=Gemmata obscuriglobus TaxID=114 RepID=A0A2Z3HKT9_9BACT|nr:sigma-70 family RNA polymerase sigma factor [Gemmata obscuriglobus]AWM42100.1 sigma-70 family RNA polymerase sigma factor [Gemmata obscuriglobus]QEG31512.1 RNA polymerase sigma factor RpoE [Gemmata obscuriglobus]
MDQQFASGTDLSLLRRLQQAPTDQVAWGNFVQRYGRRIYVWCRQWQLQEADAEDVTQSVLLILASKLREFEYDPAGSFRAWLKTVAHHAWAKYVTSQQRPGGGTGDSDTLGVLHSVEARDDLAAKLEEEFDYELLELAMLRVAQRVETRTWRAFQLLALQDVSGAEVAATLGMPVGMVYVAKSRVQKMLHEEIRQLEGRD